MGITNIEIRITTDLDVEPYVMRKDIATMYVEKSATINEITSFLKPVIDDHRATCTRTASAHSRSSRTCRKGGCSRPRRHDIEDKREQLQAMALYDYTYVLDLAHAHDLVSSEGLYPFVSYMNR